ncbi:HAD family hydrolase [Floccifex sp.]|uniref:HAD family hydrolase n=1 Tax=Floccifex sp. TaxID=2815810 RepID=UPI002A75C52F|nr:HAD family hydrolase [Floccifex sp.]MDD7281415.1 HAD family hydrolase [Erysipelotrichaceae bacterium]MDY2959117.1 HAD family hydrolase [Floccifex sp.]
MEIKCLAFDVDGTLTNDDKKIDDRTLHSIQLAMKQGIQIVICTGRNLKGCEFIYKKLNLESGNHYLSMINGQQIYSFQSKKTYHDSVFNKEDCFKIEQVAKKYHCLARFTCDNDAYFYGSLSNYIREIKRWMKRRNKKGSMVKGTKFNYHRIPFKNYEFDFPINKIVFFHNPDFFSIHLKDIQNDLNDCECMLVSDYWMEIMPKGVNKAHSLKKICELNGYTMENVMAFGDAQNDIKMLQEAGIGVAMGNALPEVKQIADIITDSNNDNGIGKVIDDIVLGNLVDETKDFV